MQELVIDLLNQFGYWGIGFLMAVENIFPPIPSEVILTFSGFMTTLSGMQTYLVILSATIGSVIGALALYLIGRLIPKKTIQNILSGKIGLYIHITTNDLSKAGVWFSEKGHFAVFFCRFIPIVRSLISIPAGMTQMNLVKFIFLTTCGSAIWNTVLVWLGAFAGDSWQSISRYMNIYSMVAFVFLGIFALMFAYKLYSRRRKPK